MTVLTRMIFKDAALVNQPDVVTFHECSAKDEFLLTGGRAEAKAGAEEQTDREEDTGGSLGSSTFTFPFFFNHFFPFSSVGLSNPNFLSVFKFHIFSRPKRKTVSLLT